jgi:hypothetical protein
MEATRLAVVPRVEITAIMVLPLAGAAAMVTLKDPAVFVPVSPVAERTRTAAAIASSGLYHPWYIKVLKSMVKTSTRDILTFKLIPLTFLTIIFPMLSTPR